MNFADFLKTMICALAVLSASVAFGDTGVGVVNGDGKVFLFYGDGDSVVLRECAPLTLLENRESCSDVQGGRELSRVLAQDLVNELVLVLSASWGTFPESMGRKVELYRLGNAQDISARIAQLRSDLSGVNERLQEIGAFVGRYGRESAGSYLDEQTRLESRKGELEREIGGMVDPAPVVADLNQRIRNLVNDINTAPLEYATHTLRQGSFEYYLLLNYWENFANTGMRFVPISAAGKRFTMGSPEHEKYRAGDEDQVTVRFTRDFEMQTTEVTQLQWFEVMGTNPSKFKSEKYCKGEHREIEGVELCPHNPVEKVTWNEVQDFITKLNQQKNDGYTYRLPTEAEWEYAARAGTTTAYSFGKDSEDLGAHGWYWDNSNSRAHKVGQKNANAWGLYDVHGNVWEWVQDDYASDLPGGIDPLQSSGRYRVVRGGSWYYNARDLRSALRSYGYPGYRISLVGFRLLRTPVTL